MFSKWSKSGDFSERYSHVSHDDFTIKRYMTFRTHYKKDFEITSISLYGLDKDLVRIRIAFFKKKIAQKILALYKNQFISMKYPKFVFDYDLIEITYIENNRQQNAKVFEFLRALFFAAKIPKYILLNIGNILGFYNLDTDEKSKSFSTEAILQIFHKTVSQEIFELKSVSPVYKLEKVSREKSGNFFPKLVKKEKFQANINKVLNTSEENSRFFSKKRKKERPKNYNKFKPLFSRSSRRKQEGQSKKPTNISLSLPVLSGKGKLPGVQTTRPLLCVNGVRNYNNKRLSGKYTSLIPNT